jgi:SPP1 family predicted phage head-tail adaptor
MRTGIGALRDRLVLEQAVRTDDGGGGATLTWETVAEIWGSVRPVSGEERLSADQLAGRLTHRVLIRYRAGVVPAMRLRFGARLLEIVGVLATPRRERLLLLCQEQYQ